ncbi:acyl carrier protein (plasmid) [Streptomyces decoyicus]|uniref:acyl carrier protein n=1 Tax=Streptomyces decoyicus TaxID=249567 RepID=UPI002E3734D5|nr:acyl carrier protein [Streptomyces decoyicus]
MTNVVTLTGEQRTQIKELVCEILEIDVADVTGTSLFKEDHDADSMSAIEILTSLEHAFSIEIDQAELTRMVNLDGAVAVVEEGLSR